MTAREALAGVVYEATAEKVIAALGDAHLLRPEPWPPIPYPDDAAHQARWTLQREFERVRWETSDTNEAMIAATDALLAEGWRPPRT